MTKELIETWIIRSKNLFILILHYKVLPNDDDIESII